MFPLRWQGLMLVCCCRGGDDRQTGSAAVDADNSTWSLDAETSSAGRDTKVLSILLARPPLSGDEIKWKKGEHGQAFTIYLADRFVKKGPALARVCVDARQQPCSVLFIASHLLSASVQAASSSYQA